MPQLIVSENQLGKQIKYNSEENKLEVNIDNGFLEANEQGVISIGKNKIKDLVGEMASDDDTNSIDYNSTTKTISVSPNALNLTLDKFNKVINLSISDVIVGEVRLEELKDTNETLLGYIIAP